MKNQSKILLAGGGMILFLLFPISIPKVLAYYASEETLAARVKTRAEIKSKYPELQRYSQVERIRRQEEYLAKIKETSIPVNEYVSAVSPVVSINTFLLDDKPSTGFFIQRLVPLIAIMGVGIALYRTAKSTDVKQKQKPARSIRYDHK